MAERETALARIDRQAPGTCHQLTLGADKAYDAREFVADLRQKCVTPHVAQKAMSSAIDARTARHAGHAVSQRKRKLVEEAFAWVRTIARCVKIKVRGLARVRHHLTLAMGAYNLIRMPRLLAPRHALWGLVRDAPSAGLAHRHSYVLNPTFESGRDFGSWLGLIPDNTRPALGRSSGAFQGGAASTCAACSFRRPTGS